MDKNERALLRELLEKATPGPWECDTEVKGNSVWTVPEQYNVADDVRAYDAALIVAAVNALPSLLDALDAAERERDAAVKAEREACAKVAECIEDETYSWAGVTYDDAERTKHSIAYSIRARSK